MKRKIKDPTMQVIPAVGITITLQRTAQKSLPVDSRI